MPCPLCASPELARSWWGTTTYRGTTYAYLRCKSCGSASCDPMPDEATIQLMYGVDYVSDGGHEAEFRNDGDVVALLRRRPAGRFLDIGCGAGSLLGDVATTGWTPLGIELDPEVAARVAAETGFEVHTPAEAAAAGLTADVVHLGDVLEHLPDPLQGLHDALRFLRPGGLLVAQGPLEANPNLFLAVMRLGRLRGGRASATLPPYHVLLATAPGQERLFDRAGLTTERFDVSEIAWPAPPRLSSCHGPRHLVLYAVRRLSKVLSRLPIGRLGNRYLYVGTAP